MTISHTRGKRSALVGMLVNFLLAATKFTAGIFGHSYALVADGIESTTDIASSFIVWLGLQVSSRPADKSHPYGHGRAEAIAATIVSLTLIAAAAAIAVASIREIRTPHFSPAPYTLVVLLLVVGVKELLFRRVNDVGSDIGSHAVQTDAWHHRSDAITSAAAFVGIVVGLIGGDGWEAADDWAALLASGIIAFNGIRLLIPAVEELMDRVSEGPECERFRGIALGVEGVLGVEKLRVRKLGMNYHVDIHVLADPSLTLEVSHAIGGRVKAAFREHVDTFVETSVHMEPYSPERVTQA